MFNQLLGIALAFLIGMACRDTNIPVPAPPTLTGALLVGAMTLGYVISNSLISSVIPKPDFVCMTKLCDHAGSRA